ncbi:H-NS histone family protein [Methylosoma difficile]
MTDYNHLSELELQAVIEQAEKALKDKLTNKRKEVLAQIKELAASINVAVEFHELADKPQESKSARVGVKVPVKYRHPQQPELTWTGRGIMPKWLQSLLDQGRDKSEFEV